MLDALTLDQLRALVAVADAGSFSAAARRLRRVQSAVSHQIAGLEAQLGVALFQRGGRAPRLTAEGALLLQAARRVLGQVGELQELARGMQEGLEPRLALAADAVCPSRVLVDATRAFQRAYPTVPLCLHTETLSAVSALVQGGACQLGVIGPAAPAQGLERAHLMTVRMVPVVAREHPLAARRGPLADAVLAEHVQIVLSERGAGGAGVEDQAVLSPRTFRIADLGTKHALLLGGLGWGNLPEHLARADLAAGRLVPIRPAAWGQDEHLLPLSLVHRRDAPLGPAGRWLRAELAALCARESAAAEATEPGRAQPAGGGAQGKGRRRR